MDETNLDVHVVEHKGNIVLVMSPWVAKVIHEISGNVTGDDECSVRQVCDAVWEAFEELNGLDVNDYFIEGSVNREKQ